jgi:hypothetical protein
MNEAVSLSKKHFPIGNTETYALPRSTMDDPGTI